MLDDDRWQGKQRRAMASAQRAYDNMTPEDDEDDMEEEDNPCRNCRRRGPSCLGTECPV